MICNRLIVCVADRKPFNFFDEFSTEWYHLWLAKLALFSSISKPVYLTHLNGTSSSIYPKYQLIYDILGNYVKWEDLSTQKSTSSLECLEFEDFITLSTGWLWMMHPLQKYDNLVLNHFIHTVSKALNIEEHEVNESCLAVLAARGPGSRNARKLLNEAILLETMASVLLECKIQLVDFKHLALHDTVWLMRRTSIFVFPHGGAGPNVLWLRPGALVVEVGICCSKKKNCPLECTLSNQHHILRIDY